MFNKNKKIIKELDERLEVWMNNYQKCNARRLELREENIRLQREMLELRLQIEELEEQLAKKNKKKTTTKKKEVKKDGK